ncbi:hypothetical protein FQN49_005656, partial [Arthroderma sp. PD_2]
TGLVLELRLDRPPQTKVWKTGIRFRSKYDPDENTYTRPSLGRDEQRAVAGLLQKQPTFPHTTYLEESCKSLYDAAEYPNDKFILHSVQLQLIVEKIDRISFRHGMELKNPGSAMELYVQNLKSELEAFRDQLGSSLDETPLIALQFHTVELSLYQLSLLDISGQQSSSTRTALLDEMLSAGRIATQSIIRLYLSLPPGSETAFNNTEWIQIGFALIIACRQASTTAQTDVILQHNELFSSTLARLKMRVAELSTNLVDSNGDKDVFSNYTNRVARLQAWYNDRLATKGFSYVGNAALEESQITGGPFDPDQHQVAGTSGDLHDFSDSNLLARMADEYRSMEDSFTFTIDQMLNSWM